MNEIDNQAQQQLRPAGRTTKGNLEYKTAGLLCYTPLLLINIICPILWLATEPKDNKYLRFHAIQGLGLVVSAVILSVANNLVFGSMALMLGGAGWQLMALLSSAIGMAFLGASVYGMYCCYTGKDFRLPILAELADKNV